ncbi:MAG: site-2 protease family protein [Peptococcaceae bacterium]|nr:site-2 protease family protein [Peptococcaceae bacterium]
MSNLSSSIINFVFMALAIIPAMCFHEYAHGWVSYKLGDPSPKTDGRLSLNPLHHIDPLGALFLLVFQFGWAKPVQVNPRYYKKPKEGMALVALAGPVANFILALICLIATTVISKVTGGSVSSEAVYYIYQFLWLMAIINVGFGVFNLIPLPPLDGSKVIGVVLPTEWYFKYMRFEQYGFILLFLLLALGAFNSPLVWLRSGVMNYLGFLADKLTFFLG